MSLLPRAVFRTVNGAVESLVRAGVGSPFVLGGGVVVLEMTGHDSGKQRHVPVLGARFGNRITVATVRSGSHWLRNVEENPSVLVWLGGKRRSAYARVSRARLNLVSIDVVDDPETDETPAHRLQAVPAG